MSNFSRLQVEELEKLIRDAKTPEQVFNSDARVVDLSRTPEFTCGGFAFRYVIKRNTGQIGHITIDCANSGIEMITTAPNFFPKHSKIDRPEMKFIRQKLEINGDVVQLIFPRLE